MNRHNPIERTVYVNTQGKQKGNTYLIAVCWDLSIFYVFQNVGNKVEKSCFKKLKYSTLETRCTQLKSSARAYSLVETLMKLNVSFNDTFIELQLRRCASIKFYCNYYALENQIFIVCIRCEKKKNVSAKIRHLRRK